MVEDVAEILAVVGADLRHAAADQLGDRFLQRPDRMLDDADLALERVQPLDVGAAEMRLEDLVLDRLELGLERVDDWKVAVDDRVEQRIRRTRGRA